MYQLISAQGLPNLQQSNWVTLEETISVKTAYVNYRRIVVVLSRTGDTENYIVDLAQLHSEYSDFENTLATMILSLGDRPLETLPSIPSMLVHYAGYAHAYQAGYRLQLAKAGYEMPSSTPYEMLPDIKMSHPGGFFDMTKVDEYCLMSVNGFYHNTTQDGQSTFILDGGKSALKAGNNSIGLTSFRKIGKLTKTKIKEDMLSKALSIGYLKDGIIVTVPDSVLGKCFFLVLGGYIVYPESTTLIQVSDNAFRLNLQNLSYLDRIYESSQYLDLSALELTENEGWETVIQGDEVWSDATITKYLTLSQTFIVSVDTDNLFFEKRAIRQANYPGHYYMPNEPEYPLIVGTGRLAEYWKKKEDNKWGLYVHDGFLRNRMYYHAKDLGLTAFAEQLSFNMPYFFSNGNLLEIGGYTNQEVN